MSDNFQNRPGSGGVASKIQNGTVGDGLNFAVNRPNGVANRPDGGQLGVARTPLISRMSESTGLNMFARLLVGLRAKIRNFANQLQRQQKSRKIREKFLK